MTRITSLESTTGRLAQAGVTASPFQIETLTISEIESVTAFRLRALPGPLHHSNDLNLPETTGKCLGNEPATLCLRPREWLMVSHSRSASELMHPLREAITDSNLTVWDQSDGLAVFRVEGKAAHWLMRKNSGLDFHVTPATENHCSQCKFGHISVIVHYHSDSDRTGVFDLIVDRSLATYLWTLLVATAPHAAELHRQS